MRKPNDDAMRDAASRKFEDEGTLEIDPDAPVSRAKGNPSKGAYVQAWVWVDDADTAEEA